LAIRYRLIVHYITLYSPDKLYKYRLNVMSSQAHISADNVYISRATKYILWRFVCQQQVAKIIQPISAG